MGEPKPSIPAEAIIPGKKEVNWWLTISCCRETFITRRSMPVCREDIIPRRCRETGSRRTFREYLPREGVQFPIWHNRGTFNIYTKKYPSKGGVKEKEGNWNDFHLDYVGNGGVGDVDADFSLFIIAVVVEVVVVVVGCCFRSSSGFSCFL